MTWPPADHPFWKALQSAISVVGLAIYAYHTAHAGHGLDPGDASGVVGGVAAGSLAWGFLRK